MTQQNDQLDFYTINQVAQKLAMSPYTIQKWVKSGKLGSVRIGQKSIRIPAGAIVALLNASEDKGAAAPRTTHCRKLEQEAPTA
jgi:excisionase family DNA binding protein